MNRHRLFRLSRLLLVLAILAATYAHSGDTQARKVKVELFIMTKCPFCGQLLQELAPALQKLSPWVDFKVGFVGSEINGELQSLHGPEEVEGNLLAACAQLHFPPSLPVFLKCLGKDPRAVPRGWELCAAAAGIDVATARACAGSAEGRERLRAAYREASARGVLGTPTLLIEGQRYDGNRSQTHLVRAICVAADPPPPPCADLPPIPRTTVTVLSDRRCQDCDTGRLKDLLRQEFLGLDLHELDYADPAGRTLFQAAEVGKLPAAILDASVDANDEAAMMRRMLVAHGRYRVLDLGAKFDPTAEICDNGIDDNGDGLIDCQDQTCRDKLVCRPEKPGQLQLFVMSQCPYAAKAVASLAPVLQKLRGALTLEVHFVVEDRGGQVWSMHGADELAEDRRMACAIHGWPRNQLAYIQCRMAQARNPDWEPCAKEAGIDPGRLEACGRGPESESYLRDDGKLCRELGIAASPTWLANNRHVFSGIEAEDIMQKFCAFNSSLPGCPPAEAQP